MKTETGVMVMKDGKAWGPIEPDSLTMHGWLDPEFAPMHDPKTTKKPADVTWNGSPYTEEIETGKLVYAIRTTTVTFEKAFKDDD